MRILIVTWAWPPIGRVGALRPLGMAAALVRAGHEVHVLTGPGDRGGEYAPDLEGDARASGAVVHRAQAPGIAPPEALVPAHEKTDRDLVAARRVSRARQILAQWRTFPDYQRSWIEPAAKRGAEIVAAHRIDVVWSTSPPESAHFVGRRLAAGGAAWVADFRDPWAEYALARWDAASRIAIGVIARRILRGARGLTANAEGIARSIAHATGREVVCIRNGCDSRPGAGRPVSARVLGYFGRVDPEVQNPARLWEPLRRRRAAGAPWRVEFYLSSGGGGGAAIVPPADLVDLVGVRPSLPHSQALQRMQEMGGLLVLPFEARGGELVVQAKFYEYVSSRRPILVIAPPGYEARALVEQTGTGLAAWGDAGIAEALEGLEAFEPDASGAATLQRDALAARLAELLSRAVAGHARCQDPPP